MTSAGSHDHLQDGQGQGATPRRSRRRRRLAPAGLFLALSLGLAACSGGGEAVDTGGGTGDGSGGGTLVAAISGEPDQLDPQSTTSYFSFQVLENVYDTLVQPDENLEMQPALAESWDTSEDGMTWTFHLREGVTWHDGSPFTADDVVYSFNRIIDEDLANSWRLVDVEEITAVDEHTVEFRMSQPAANLLPNLGGFKGVAVVQQENVESGEIGSHPIGTGPFTFESYASGSSINLAANEDYWDGAPEVAGVEFQFITEATTAMSALDSGQVHWTDNVPPQQVESLQGGQHELGQVGSNDYWYVTMNEAEEPFDSVEVRRAIAFAIDREAITEAVMFGNAQVNQLAIPESSEWYVEHHPYTHDPAQAEQLLEEAGVEPGSLTVDMMVTNEYPETVQAAQIMADQLGEVGITLNIRTLDFGAWLDEQGNGTWDMLMLGWLGNIDPDSFYYAQHHSEGSNNHQGYSNPEVDQLLEDGRTELDQQARHDIYAEAARTIADEASYIYLYNPDVVQVWSSDVGGYQTLPDRAVRFKDVTLEN